MRVRAVPVPSVREELGHQSTEHVDKEFDREDY
jgi:hypothetical protein